MSAAISERYPALRGARRSGTRLGQRAAARRAACALDLSACHAVGQSMAHPNELDAVYALLVAAAVTALLTPLTMRLARRIGAIDEPRARGLSVRPTPLLGGLAIFGGVIVSMAIWLPPGYFARHLWQGVMIGCAVITLVGAIDDRFELHPAVKLVGQIVAAVIVVHFGVAVKAITLPFVGHLAFPNAGVTNAGPVLTVLGLVVMMNVVNFSDGVDGLTAGSARSSPARWRSSPLTSAASSRACSRPSRPERRSAS